MGESEELKATIAGVPVAVKGINMAVVVLLAITVAVLLYLVAVLSTVEHTEIGDNLKSIGDILEEQNYFVLSDEQERQEIKKRLRQPPSLLKKLDR